jgi:hypothetical protein
LNNLIPHLNLIICPAQFITARLLNSNTKIYRINPIKTGIRPVFVISETNKSPLMAKSTKKTDKSKPNTSEAEIYLTNTSASNITLDIRIGPAGQTGSSHVKLDDDLKLNGHPDELKNFPVGTNLECKNKFLSAATVVVAMSDVDNIDLVYVVKGGADPTLSIPLWSGPLTQGQKVVFDITVFLF